MPARRLFTTYFQKHKKSVYFCSIFIFSLLFLFIVHRFFSVSVIELFGSEHINGVDTLSKKNIFFISIPETEKNLYKNNPDIQSVQVVKIYPQTLYIAVQKAHPVAQLVVANGFFLLTKEGRIIAKQRDQTPHVPIVSYYQKLHLHEHEIGEILTQKDILLSVFFIHRFAQAGIVVAHVDIASVNMIVLFADDKKYLFTADKEKDEQFEIFNTIYTHMKIEGVEYRSLDMRFEKPIIKINK